MKNFRAQTVGCTEVLKKPTYRFENKNKEILRSKEPYQGKFLKVRVDPDRLGSGMFRALGFEYKGPELTGQREV